MPLTIAARLRFGRYDAATSGWRTPEWPPHPGRLFCALVASATTDQDWSALEWLERQPPPCVFAPGVVDQREYQGYVPTNTTEPKGGSQLWPGRTNGERVRVSTLPAHDCVHFGWDASPEAEIARALRRLCARVPYLGRSTGSVTLSMAEAAVDAPGLTRFAPTTIDQPGIDLTVPYPGYLAHLRDLHDRGGRAWEAGRTHRYARPETPAAAPAGYRRSTFEDLLVLRVEGPSIPGALFPLSTMLLRKAIMRRVDDPIPEVLSGHDRAGAPLRSGRPHVGFLGFPHVGTPHATGAVLGLGIAMPAMSSEDRAAIVRGVVADDGAVRLMTKGFQRTVRLVADPQTPLTVRPGRWIGRSPGHRTWVTATPAMLDHHPKGNRPVEEIVARSCEYAGLPRPLRVVAGRGPRIQGAVTLDPRQVQVLGRPPRPLVHAAVRFAEPVLGPVVIGALRSLGLGLMVPIEDVWPDADKGRHE